MSDSLRALSVTLVAEPKQVRSFTLTQWRIAELVPGDEGECVLNLQLYMTERAAYRFNLTAPTPRLFVRAGFTGQTPETRCHHRQPGCGRGLARWRAASIRSVDADGDSGVDRALSRAPR